MEQEPHIDLREFATQTTLKELFEERETLRKFLNLEISKEQKLETQTGTSKEETSPTPGDVIFFYNTDRLELALNVLAERNILSAPVFKKQDVEDKSLDSFLGFVDARDAVTFIVKNLPPPSVLASNDLAAMASVLNASLGDVIATGTHERVTLNENQSVLDALAVFSGGVHIVGLVGDQNEITGVISQIDVARSCSLALSPNGLLKDLAQVELKELQTDFVLAGGVERVSSSQTVLEALTTLVKEHVSAIPMVDVTGRLVGNFSAADVRGLVNPKAQECLLGNVYEFVSLISPMALSPKAVILKTKFVDAISELLADQVHRLWVVDKNFSPSGCLSLTDVSNIFLKAISGRRDLGKSLSKGTEDTTSKVSEGVKEKELSEGVKEQVK